MTRAVGTTRKSSVAVGLAGLLSILAGTSAALSRGQEEGEESTTRPGLVATFTSGAAVDRRIERLAALHVAAGASPTSLLAPGPFRAQMRCDLVLRIRSKLRLRASGRGALKLRIGDETVLEASGDDLSSVESAEARYSKGASPLVIEYEAPAQGEAWFRLEWAGPRFDWEPVPPEVLRIDPAAAQAEVAEHQLLRQGRERFAQLRCARCHLDRREELAAHGMPELDLDAPDLSEVGARLHAPWIAAWILDPRAFRPTATMPRLLPHRELSAAVEAGDTLAVDLATWLSRRGAAMGAAEGTAEQVQEGGALFAELGCVACHLRPDASSDEDAAGHDRIPLRHVAQKWTRSGLSDFLRAPHRDYRWIRMPDLALEGNEAEALSAFLLARSSAVCTPLPPLPEGDPLRGAAAYVSLGCAACHGAVGAVASAEPVGTGAPLLPLEETGPTARPGCLDGGTGLPNFDLRTEDRAALVAFLELGRASLGQRNVAEFATRQVRALQCNACHAIDEAHDRWAQLVVETQDLERPPEEVVLAQTRPALTWVGEKLHTSMVESLLDGSCEFRIRPWLHARMPAFPARAKLLAEGLAAQHGMGPSLPGPAVGAPEQRAVGELLLGTKGFACNACHGIGAQPATSTFEFGTPNLALAHTRIRPGYFLRWMLDPLRVEPGSKMPRFADDDGGSPFEEYYDGDIRAQFEAIRAYLSTLSPESAVSAVSAPAGH